MGSHEPTGDDLMKYNFLLGILLLGSVDYIEGDIATVEIINSDYEIIMTALPVEIFPCEIEEGDMFYFTYVNGVTEIRCGELT